MSESVNTYQQALRAHLLERQIRNPNYSLRSLARKIGMSPTLLSQLLSGQRRLTVRSAEKIAAGIDLSPAQSAVLLSGVGKQTGSMKREDITRLSDDQFRAVSEWYHYAILGLAHLSENFHDPAWIARKLGIPVGAARAAFVRLQKMGFVARVGEGFRQAISRLETGNDVPSLAIRKYHRQNLEKAIESLTNDPVDTRYFCSLTVAIDPDDLSALKAAIVQFKERFHRKCAVGTKRRVYQLGVQFFPLDKGE